MTDRLCIHSDGKYHDEVSAEDLLSCCGSFCGDGCDGGYPTRAWIYWTTMGIVTGGGYESNKGCKPYGFPPCDHVGTGQLPRCNGSYATPECVRRCRKGYERSYGKDLQFGNDAYQVEGETEIMTELMNNGPMEADFLVYSDFPSYKSGVYQHLAGHYLGGHAVKLIGWGVEGGTKYWQLVNSWNDQWGDNGTFKILRGVDECEIESEVIGGTPLFE
ncbi:unnamed protein product [Protopolystoma xenopodis]|uniref:Peptidase C1A papain C-terminal domain-containing protein n=1 Tax=Protopolystoma xenopodis TaxID=117903 RepID=A0A448WVR5_9PLAT|nr:unnamed protein product [Protopolystoma xenopodis]